MIRRIRFPVDQYGADIWLIVGRWEEISAYVMKTHEIELPDCRGYHYTIADVDRTIAENGETQVMCICLDKIKSKIDKLSTLAHECIHCANAILENAGVTVSSKDDEALAYYFEWLYRHALVNVL